MNAAMAADHATHATYGLLALAGIAAFAALAIRHLAARRAVLIRRALMAAAPSAGLGPGDAPPSPRRDDAPAPPPGVPIQGTHQGVRDQYHTPGGGVIAASNPAGWPDYARASRPA